jgi:hypothetical protein
VSQIKIYIDEDALDSDLVAALLAPANGIGFLWLLGPILWVANQARVSRPYEPR